MSENRRRLDLVGGRALKKELASYAFLTRYKKKVEGRQ